jgi:hypothetical protein
MGGFRLPFLEFAARSRCSNSCKKVTAVQKDQSHRLHKAVNES